MAPAQPLLQLRLRQQTHQLVQPTGLVRATGFAQREDRGESLEETMWALQPSEMLEAER
jgi:hypothetical protein